MYALIYSVLNTIYAVHYSSKFTPSMVGMFTGLGVIIMIILTYIQMFAWVFIGSVLLHFFVWVLGGKMGYEETLKSCLYSSTQILLFEGIVSISFLSGHLALAILGMGITIIVAIWSLIFEYNRVK